MQRELFPLLHVYSLILQTINSIKRKRLGETVTMKKGQGRWLWTSSRRDIPVSSNSRHLRLFFLPIEEDATSTKLVPHLLRVRSNATLILALQVLNSVSQIKERILA